MEEFGGPDALKHIRFSIPLCKLRHEVKFRSLPTTALMCHLYLDESCLQPKDLHAVKR